MALDLTTRKVPLQVDGDGVVRVAGTRVSLDTVVGAFDEGRTPEEIAQQYPSLALGDVYAVIAYYLDRQRDVQAYLAEREAGAARVRSENEGRHPPDGVRERLLRRRSRSNG